MPRSRIQTFTARDASGREYTIHVYVASKPPIVNFEGSHPPGAGLKSLETADGFAVNRDGKGKYHLVNSREPLTSDDPSAP